jgi:hypothetical protein
MPASKEGAHAGEKKNLTPAAYNRSEIDYSEGVIGEKEKVGISSVTIHNAADDCG